MNKNPLYDLVEHTIDSIHKKVLQSLSLEELYTEKADILDFYQHNGTEEEKQKELTELQYFIDQKLKEN